MIAEAMSSEKVHKKITQQSLCALAYRPWDTNAEGQPINAVSSLDGGLELCRGQICLHLLEFKIGTVPWLECVNCGESFKKANWTIPGRGGTAPIWSHLNPDGSFQCTWNQSAHRCASCEVIPRNFGGAPTTPAEAPEPSAAPVPPVSPVTTDGKMSPEEMAAKLAQLQARNRILEKQNTRGHALMKLFEVSA